MKRKLLFTIVALLCSVGTWAAADYASATYSDPFTVTATNLNFDAGNTNNWEASGFVYHEDGRKFAEIYGKASTACYIKRTLTGLKAGHYKMAFSAGARGNNIAGNVYAYIGNQKMTINGEPYSSYVIDYDLAADGDVEIGIATTASHTAQWVAFDDVEIKYYGPTSNYVAARNKVVFTSGVDLTSLIVNADISKSLGNWPLTSGSCGNQQGGSGAMESWNNNNMTVSQAIIVPNGKYRITVDMISGNDTKQAYLFASSGGNEVHSDVVSAQSGDGRNNYGDMCTDVNGNTLTIDNFSVTDGSITIGVKDPSNGGWIVFDNFTLTRISFADGTDFTTLLNNAAVASTTGWANGRTAADQQYTGAPDNTYLDTWNENRNQNQTVTLLEGYYLLKVATRADANVSNGNVYAHDGSSNIGSDNIHREGSTGNLLGNGWAWTRFGFHVDEAKSVSIGFYSECGSSKWAGADDFHLYYYTTELAMKQAHLAGVVADANAWAEKLTTTTALESALSASAPSCSTVEECNTAISNLTTTIANARAAEAPYVEFNRLKAGANSIKDVEYTESVDGAYATFTAVIPAQTTVADNATTAAAVNTAISTLKSAIKTYINNAEPKNEGEFFDVTCLMANPDFSTGDATGWTYGSAPGVNWSNCEYYQTEFDIYQTVTGLPTGSYSLNVQAYQRPGEAGTVYNDYIGGTDNATSVLYINSITSKVKNIAADAQATQKLGDGNFNWPNDSRVGSEGSYKFVPNSQEGAKLYFDAGLYDATCAAVITDVDEGSLKLGFKSTQTHVDYDWTIFDNFRLRYYGSSLLVYYQQYWPQLKEEVEADLANAAYTNVLVSSEDEAVDAALAASPSTESEYETAISNLATARDNFRAAKTPYDAIVAEKAASAMTKISANVGTGVFQYNDATNNSMYSAYETAKSAVDNYTFTTSSTAAEAQDLVDDLDDAIDAYNNQTLNAPGADKRYNVSIVDDGQAWDGNAITFIAGGRTDMGNFAVQYLASSNAYMCQALMFTAVEGEANTYKISAIRADGGEQYLTTGSVYDGGNNTQIRTTDDASKASWIKIQATPTNGQFQLLNVSDGNKVIGRNATNPDNGMYTDGNVSFTIAEASPAIVEFHIAAGKLATRIFPFTPTLPDGVEAYSCAGNNGSSLTLEKVNAPEANKPYILYSENEVQSTELTGWGTATADDYTEGYLTGVYTNAVVPAGSYVLQTPTSGDNAGVQAFYMADGEGKSSAYRAYVTVPAETPQGQVKMFTVNLEELTDAIKTARAAGETTIRYNLAGQRVSDAQKGIVIVNGKKVLVK